MKVFIYYEQGQWRMFQAEELPVKPIITDIFKSDMSLANRSRIYESEIAALKAKSILVGNPEICPQNLSAVKEGEIIEWPGTAEKKKSLHCDQYHAHEKESCFVVEYVLHLPNRDEKKIVEGFANKIIQGSKDIDPDIRAYVNKHWMELVGGEPVPNSDMKSKTENSDNAEKELPHDQLKKLLNVLENETVPMSGHQDSGAIKDCWRHADDLVDEMLNECSRLAANTCPHSYGDEWGNQHCSEVDKLKRMQEENAALREAVKELLDIAERHYYMHGNDYSVIDRRAAIEKARNLLKP